MCRYSSQFQLVSRGILSKHPGTILVQHSEIRFRSDQNVFLKVRSFPGRPVCHILPWNVSLSGSIVCDSSGLFNGTSLDIGSKGIRRRFVGLELCSVPQLISAPAKLVGDE